MRIVAIRDIVVADPLQHRQRLYRLQPDDGERRGDRHRRRSVDGKPVVGYGFNSNGRYAQQGLLRERFIPRLPRPARTRCSTREGLLDPAKCWAAMMAQREAGRPRRALGRGRRARHGAVGCASPRPKRVPLWRLLADRYNGGKADDKAWVYAAGGYYYPGKDIDGAAGRDEALSRPRLFLREDEDRRRAARRGSQAHRGGAEDRRRGRATSAVDVNGRFDLDEAIAFGKALAPYGLRWYEEPLDPLDYLRARGPGRRATRRRSPPARTCSRCRTRAT